VSVTVHPSGGFVYVINASSNNISAYSIDPVTGALTAVSGSPFATGLGPFSLEVDPSGKYAYVADSQSNSVSAFSIDAGTGALTPIAGSPFAAGTTPISVTVAPRANSLTPRIPPAATCLRIRSVRLAL
jgi:YVTN family beta-propeller protein